MNSKIVASIILLLTLFVALPVNVWSAEKEISLDELDNSSTILQNLNPLRLLGKTYDDKARQTIITGYAVASYRTNDNGVDHDGVGNELHYGQDPANTSRFGFDLMEVGFTKRFSDYAWVAAAFEIGQHNEPGGTLDTEIELDQGEIHLVAPVGNGLDFAIGKFNSPVSWEHEDAPLLLQASNSLTFQFASPIKMTGVMATYPILENLEVRGAVYEGWDRNTSKKPDNNKAKSLMLQIGYAPTPWLDTKISYLIGAEADNNEDDLRKVIDIAATLTPWKDWIIGLEFAFGEEENQSAKSPGTDGKWYSGQVTVHYDFNRWLGTTLRYSFFDDRDGIPDIQSSQQRTLNEITFAPTLHIAPEYLGYMGLGVLPRTQHMLSGIDLRLEYRYDWSNEASTGTYFFDVTENRTKSSRNTFIAQLVASF